MDKRTKDENIKHLSKMDPKQLLRKVEVAEFMNISQQTLYRRCKAGLIPYVKVSRGVRFEAGAILNYIESYRVGVE